MADPKAWQFRHENGLSVFKHWQSCRQFPTMGTIKTTDTNECNALDSLE